MSNVMYAPSRRKGWRPTAPARLHLKNLSAAGIGVAQTALIADLPPSSVEQIALGTWQRARSDIIAALLAVPIDPLYLAADSAVIDGTGTRRRVQAMSVLGMSLRYQADFAGVNHESYREFPRASRVQARHARAVASMYDDIHRSRVHSGRARTEALKKGWFGPEAWPGTSIDDPTACPQHPKAVRSAA